MDFDSLLGNAPIKAFLQRAIERQTLPQTLLFAGPDGVGKSLFAKVTARMLLQSNDDRVMKEFHPDFHVIRPEGKTGLHSMETLREMIDEVHTTPFEATRKVFVIHDAERMQTAQSNALLKTLEEPNPDTTIILLTSHLSEIIPTILSRSVRLYFQPLSQTEVETFLQSHDLPKTLAKQAHGSLREALDLKEMDFLRKMVFFILENRLSYPDRTREIEKLENAIEDEDPMKKHRKVAHVFASILMWYRDQAARQSNVPNDTLLFPEEVKDSCLLSSLEKVISSVEKARAAFERNIKFSVCLESVLGSMPEMI